MIPIPVAMAAIGLLDKVVRGLSNRRSKKDIKLLKNTEKAIDLLKSYAENDAAADVVNPLARMRDDWADPDPTADDGDGSTGD